MITISHQPSTLVCVLVGDIDKEQSSTEILH
jgi:hypothetical protein